MPTTKNYKFPFSLPPMLIFASLEFVRSFGAAVGWEEPHDSSARPGLAEDKTDAAPARDITAHRAQQEIEEWEEAEKIFHGDTTSPAPAAQQEYNDIRQEELDSDEFRVAVTNENHEPEDELTTIDSLDINEDIVNYDAAGEWDDNSSLSSSPRPPVVYQDDKE